MNEGFPYYARVMKHDDIIRPKAKPEIVRRREESEHFQLLSTA